METHKIVIIGAGFGGLRTALELAKRKVRLKAFEITLIDPRPEHLYTPLLYEVSSGDLELSSDACVGELQSGACVQIDAVRNIIKKKNIRFVQATVATVDAAEQTLVLSSGETIPYDDLVVAVGVESATYGIAGADEFALPMKTLKDAFAIRERMFEFIRSYKDGKEKRLSILVVGGGASGTEFASETANFFHRMVDEETLLRQDYDISLVEAGPDILSMFPAPVRRCARERLHALGINVLAATKLKSLEANAVTLERGDGTTVRHEADVIVWTAGVKSLDVVKTWGFPVDDRGYVKVTPNFLVEGTKNVYALGDCAAFTHPKTKRRVPALAQAAVKEAAIVAENIARTLERKLPMSWTPPDRWVTVVPMGGAYAIADFGWFHLTGVLGYLIRKVADLQYFLSILPVGEAWKLWSSGAKVYRKND